MTIKKVLNTKWVIMLFLLGLFTPNYFDQNVTAKAILNGLKLIASIAVALLYFINIKAHLKKQYNIVLIILCVELLISTLFSDDASMYTYATQVIDMLIPSFLVGAIAIHSPVNGFKAIYYYFSACVVVNTITYILFPGALYADIGGWRCWFLGADNSNYSYYVVASTLAMLYCSCIKKKITLLSIMVWISGFIFAFGRAIGSGMICQVIWAILFLLYYQRWTRKLLKARYIFYVTVICILGIVVFRNLIIGSVAAAVGKDITLTGRTLLWDNVIKAVMRRPVLGYGVCDENTFKRICSTHLGGPHNYILFIMLWGGFIALTIFALLLIKSAKASSTAKKTDFYKCVVIGLIVLSVRLMVETGNYNHFYILLAMLNYSPEFSGHLCLTEAPTARA